MDAGPLLFQQSGRLMCWGTRTSSTHLQEALLSLCRSQSLTDSQFVPPEGSKVPGRLGAAVVGGPDDENAASLWLKKVATLSCGHEMILMFIHHLIEAGVKWKSKTTWNKYVVMESLNYLSLLIHSWPSCSVYLITQYFPPLYLQGHRAWMAATLSAPLKITAVEVGRPTNATPGTHANTNTNTV